MSRSSRFRSQHFVQYVYIYILYTSLIGDLAGGALHVAASLMAGLVTTTATLPELLCCEVCDSFKDVIMLRHPTVIFILMGVVFRGPDHDHNPNSVMILLGAQRVFNSFLLSPFGGFGGLATGLVPRFKVTAPVDVLKTKAGPSRTRQTARQTAPVQAMSSAESDVSAMLRAHGPFVFFKVPYVQSQLLTYRELKLHT